MLRFRNPSFIIQYANIEMTLSRLHTAFGLVPKEYNWLTVKIYLFGLRRVLWSQNAVKNTVSQYSHRCGLTVCPGPGLAWPEGLCDEEPLLAIDLMLFKVKDFSANLSTTGTPIDGDVTFSNIAKTATWAYFVSSATNINCCNNLRIFEGIIINYSIVKLWCNLRT